MWLFFSRCLSPPSLRKRYSANNSVELYYAFRLLFKPGMWKDGHQSGHGVETTKSHFTYTGLWELGVKHGEGHQVGPGGYSYVGNWKSGKKEDTGRAVEVYSKSGTTAVYKSSYTGQFKASRREGVGLMVYSDGTDDVTVFSYYHIATHPAAHADAIAAYVTRLGGAAMRKRTEPQQHQH